MGWLSPYIHWPKPNIILLGLLLCIAVYTSNAQATNSFKPGQVWLDNNQVPINAHGGGVIYFSNKYYWFGEHKTAGPIGNTAQVGVHCYSSTNLYNWRDEGIVLAVTDDAQSEIAKGCILERPKVIYNKKTKKFVMWFHLEPKGKGYLGALSGVAVSDKVTGPYTYVKSVRPDKVTWPVNVLPQHQSKPFNRFDLKFRGDRLPEHADSLNIIGRDFANGQMARDMTLFVDENGTAYQIYASEENSTLHISQLSDDYLSHAGRYARVMVSQFREAPALFKHHGKYYLITSGCTGWAPNTAQYAVADDILGNWTIKGDPCTGDNAKLTFGAQSTFVIPVQGKKGAYIFMADRWTPKNPIDGTYIWLPVKMENDNIEIKWLDNWNLYDLKTK
jgi:hypothetical protein